MIQRSPHLTVPDAAMRERRDRARGALVGVVIGDALGARFEGHPGGVDTDVLERHLGASIPLRGTDDTVMTLALGESLLRHGGIDTSELFEDLRSAWARDPHRGFGAGAAQLFGESSTDGDGPTRAGRMFGGAGSFGNGAAMRVTPCAVFAAGDLDAVAQLARRSASVTHTHPIGEQSAVAQAIAVAASLGGVALRLDELVPVVKQRVPPGPMRSRLDRLVQLDDGADPRAIAELTGTSVAGHEAVCAAIAVACLANGFHDAIRLSIRLGGDTDTIASMAAAIVGASSGMSGIPPRWIGTIGEVADMIRLAAQLVTTS